MARGAGRPPEEILAADVLAGGRRRAARRGSRSGSPRALRGAGRHDLPGLLRAAAARRGARGRRRPVRGAGRPRRPAGDAARAHRRAAAAPPRPARQPERAARLDRRAHRPPQGRAGHLPRTTPRGRRRSTTADAERARAAREREFAELFRAHDRMLGRGRARSTSATSSLRAFRLLREKPHVRARLAGALPARARRRPAGHELRPGPAAAAARRRARQRHRGGRRRPGDPPLPRRRDEDVRRLPGGVARARASCAWRSRFRCGERIAARPPRRSRRRSPDRLDKPLRAPTPAAGRGRVLALRLRARAGAGRRRRGRAADRARGRRARGRLRARALGALARARRSRSRSRSARCPYRLAGAAAFFQRAEVRDLLAWLRLLVDPGDAGAVVRALARPPVELRAIDLARVHPDRPPAQARHGRRAGRRARVAADPARGARPHPRTSSGSTAAPPARSTRRGPTSTCTG